MAAASSLAAEEGLLIHPCRLVEKRTTAAKDELYALVGCDVCHRRGVTVGLEASLRHALTAEVTSASEPPAEA